MRRQVRRGHLREAQQALKHADGSAGGGAVRGAALQLVVRQQQALRFGAHARLQGPPHVEQVLLHRRQRPPLRPHTQPFRRVRSHTSDYGWSFFSDCDGTYELMHPMEISNQQTQYGDSVVYSSPNR